MDDNVLRIGPLELEASGDYLILLRDEFRSGYECRTCNGSGETPCVFCGGTGNSPLTTDSFCTMCEGRKTQVCPSCKGKTVEEGGIVVPDNKKNLPTTGTIVSTGPNVKYLRRQQEVMFPNYAGHQLELSAVDLEGNEIDINICIMHESEVICKCRGHLELRRLKKKIAAFTTA